MRLVYFYGQQTEMTEGQFLSLLNGISEATHANYIGFHSSLGGFPDVTGNIIKKSWRERGVNNIETILPQIEDESLRELFRALGATVQTMYDLDNQMVEVVALFFKLPSPETKKDLQKVARRMDRAGGAIWLHEPAYQELVHKLYQTFQELDEIKARIDEVLTAHMQNLPEEEQIVLQEDDIDSIPPPSKRRLYTPRIFTRSGESKLDLDDFGDQRAKDLIDEAAGEFDPQEAIQLLRRALRYGRTGIQARKAYQDIAMRYEEQGKLGWAIRNYTKAIEAYGPSALLLFQRGELYYKRKQWLAAKEDFEAMLNHVDEENIFASEFEQTHHYLKRLNEILES